MVFSFEYRRTHHRSHENRATQANRRPRTSKRWERQNSNAAATATAAPQTSAYPKSNSACSLHSTGAAGKRDMQRLLDDCSTLPNESFVVWQHFWSTNIADRLALRRPVTTPFYRKQTHTANPRHADFLQTKYRPYIFRRLATTGMSNATKCRAFAVFDKSASSIQNKIAHSTHGEGDPTLACKTTRGKHCYPVRRGASVCAPPLWHKKENLQRLQVLFLQKHFSGDI